MDRPPESRPRTKILALAGDFVNVLSFSKNFLRHCLIRADYISAVHIVEEMHLVYSMTRVVFQEVPRKVADALAVVPRRVVQPPEPIRSQPSHTRSRSAIANLPPAIPSSMQSVFQLSGPPPSQLSHPRAQRLFRFSPVDAALFIPNEDLELISHIATYIEIYD